MTTDNTHLQEQDLRALEVRVEELIGACTHLKDENKTLKANKEDILTERNHLHEATELARSRVEAMIERLKQLEEES